MTNETPSTSIVTCLERAHKAFLTLGKTQGTVRNQAVSKMAQAMKTNLNEILEANTLDLEISREMAVPELVIDWLKLTPERLQITVQILSRLAELSDPLQRLMNAPYQLNPYQTHCQLMPLGVVALIYEAFPELGAIAAGLSIKTGNSIILRGLNIASNSNSIIARILQNALKEANLPSSCIEFIAPEQNISIQDLVVQDQYLSLIIPYGRPSLIQQVTKSATAPVLKSAMGNCYLYWSESGDLNLVKNIIIDSHASEPDPVNAIEKVLINTNQKSNFLIRLFNSLQDQDFQLRGDGELVAQFPEYLSPVELGEWQCPYLKKIIAFKSVESLAKAIAWINQYSSGHADCIVTESYQESREFAMTTDSALVYINNSPRFYRNPKGGESVFLGMSNQKGQRRGLIGVETFTTLKQIVQGEGKPGNWVKGG